MCVIFFVFRNIYGIDECKTHFKIEMSFKNAPKMLWWLIMSDIFLLNTNLILVYCSKKFHCYCVWVQVNGYETGDGGGRAQEEPSTTVNQKFKAEKEKQTGKGK